MSITCAKLAKLADYYGFDLDEAREYIGLPPSGKRGRPIGSGSCEKKPKVEKPKVEKSKVEKPKIEKSKVEKPKVEKPTKVEKPKKVEKLNSKSCLSGYQLFLKEYQPILTAKHKANLKPGQKLNIADILNGVTCEWNALSDNKRKLWNQIAPLRAN